MGDFDGQESRFYYRKPIRPNNSFPATREEKALTTKDTKVHEGTPEESFPSCNFVSFVVNGSELPEYHGTV